MKKGMLELRQIIWQITGKCSNGCKYCGSKSVWSEGQSDDKIKEIAVKLSEMSSIQKINVSGGDPMVVDIDTHKFVIDVFKNARTDRKIAVIANPKSAKKEVLQLYDFFGLSVNTKEQLELAKKLFPIPAWTNQLGLCGRMTVITNFNTQNIFLFDKIKDFVNERQATWQIQYTVVNSTINPDLAIYDNDEAYLYLQSKLSSSGWTKIVIADNMSDGPCGAGTYSAGILNNGDVVPCLSMRDWHRDVKSTIQGNVLKTPLRKIWSDGFKEYRFGQFTCCKDVCKNKVCNIERRGCGNNGWLLRSDPSTIHVYYGVSIMPGPKKIDLNRPMVYGVNKPNVQMYAVFPNDDSGTPPRFVYGTTDPQS